MAENAGISSVSVEGGEVTLRLPSLTEDGAVRQYPNLGRNVRTGRNAIWFAAEADWTDQLITVLTALRDNPIEVKIAARR